MRPLTPPPKSRRRQDIERELAALRGIASVAAELKHSRIRIAQLAKQYGLGCTIPDSNNGSVVYWPDEVAFLRRYFDTFGRPVRTGTYAPRSGVHRPPVLSEAEVKDTEPEPEPDTDDEPAAALAPPRSTCLQCGAPAPFAARQGNACGQHYALLNTEPTQQKGPTA